jgi:GNAT superfamily N-acetyltransferase
MQFIEAVNAHPLVYAIDAEHAIGPREWDDVVGFQFSFATKIDGRVLGTDEVMLKKLDSYPQKQGYGSRFMEFVTSQLDVTGTTCYVQAIPTKQGISPQKLMEFYENHGFKRYASPCIMMRAPKTP